MSHLFSPAQSAIQESPLRRITRLARHIFVVSLALLAAATTAFPQSAPQFVYVAQTTSHLIFGFQLNPTTGALTPVPGSPFDERLSPGAMAVNPAGTFLFIANNADNDISVFQINTTTGALTEVPNSPFSAGIAQNPVVLITDPTSKYLFVGNNNTNVVNAVGELDVYIIDPVTGELTPGPTSTPPQQGLFAPANLVGIYMHPNGLWVYLQGNNGFDNGGEDEVAQYVFDPSTGNVGGGGNPLIIGEGSTALAGDPAGEFLFTGWGGPATGRLSPLTISPVDGTLTQGNSFDICTYLNEMSGCLNHFFQATVDSTGTYLYTNVGSFFTNPLTPDQVVLGSPIPQGPWVADKLGNFVLAFDTSSGLHVYSIDPSTGNLTDASGSPYTNVFLNTIVVTGFPPQTIAPLEGFSPAGLTFTNTTIGVPSSPQTLEIVNPGTAPLTISNISVTGTNAADFGQTNTCTAPLNPGQNCTATVIYTPSTTAAESASLTVTDNAAGSPQSAPLTATGIISTPPSAVFNPTSLTFSQTSIGATLSQNIQLTNTGTQTLTISPASITGPNPGDFTQSTNCGASLAGGASCTITVGFQPQAVGQRTATLNFPNNGGPQTVALSGQGVNPFSVASAGPTTATVMPGQQANYTVNFTPAATFSGTVTFTCSVVPVGPSCSVNPTSMQVGASSNPATTPLMVTANAPAAAAKHAGVFGMAIPGAQRALSWIAVLLSLALLGWLGLSRRGTSRSHSCRLQLRHVAITLAIATGCAFASCGGGGGAGGAAQAQNFTVTFTATSGANSQSTNLTMVVQ